MLIQMTCFKSGQFMFSGDFSSFSKTGCDDDVMRDVRRRHWQTPKKLLRATSSACVQARDGAQSHHSLCRFRSRHLSPTRFSGWQLWLYRVETAGSSEASRFRLTMARGTLTQHSPSPQGGLQAPRWRWSNT